MATFDPETGSGTALTDDGRPGRVRRGRVRGRRPAAAAARPAGPDGPRGRPGRAGSPSATAALSHLPPFAWLSNHGRMTADDITRQPEPARTRADLQPDDADGALAADFDGHDLPVAPDLPDDRFLNRELSWLDFNARVLALAEDRRPAAAGAGEVPGDLRQQPGRVLHGPGRRAEAPRETGPAGARRRRADRRASSSALIADAHPGAGRPARGAASPTTSRPALAEAGHPDPALGRPDDPDERDRLARRTSAPRSSRCSPRSRSTRRTRSRTSPGSR